MKQGFHLRSNLAGCSASRLAPRSDRGCRRHHKFCRPGLWCEDRGDPCGRRMLWPTGRLWHFPVKQNVGSLTTGSVRGPSAADRTIRRRQTRLPTSSAQTVAQPSYCVRARISNRLSFPRLGHRCRLRRSERVPCPIVVDTEDAGATDWAASCACFIERSDPPTPSRPRQGRAGPAVRSASLAADIPLRAGATSDSRGVRLG